MRINRLAHDRSRPNPPIVASAEHVEKIMSAVRVHHYAVDPADLEQLLARRAQLIAGIRSGFAGLLETRLTRLEDGTYQDVWRWETAQQRDAAVAAAGGFPPVADTMALTHDGTVQNGDIIDER
jgi:hypothetical protein